MTTSVSFCRRLDLCFTPIKYEGIAAWQLPRLTQKRNTTYCHQLSQFTIVQCCMRCRNLKFSTGIVRCNRIRVSCSAEEDTSSKTYQGHIKPFYNGFIVRHIKVLKKGRIIKPSWIYVTYCVWNWQRTETFL